MSLTILVNHFFKICMIKLIVLCLSAAVSRPNIVIILADDMGWNDVGFHGSDEMPTPNIDALAYQGVSLHNHYVQPCCTPSRGALMSGKYPIHTGSQGFPIYPSEPRGFPTSETMLPEYLKKLGYATHLIGKWHLGYQKKEYTPLQRGFDSHLGYWNGYISYYDHDIEDIRDRKVVGHDFWRNYTPAWDLQGKYVTDIITDESVSVISSHDSKTPLFLFISHCATHAGNDGQLLEAPVEEVDKFQHIKNPNRRKYAAMVSKLDQSVGDVVDALNYRNMLKNTIIIFVSDNGAPMGPNFPNWGSNLPFRGQKLNLWEGGVKTACVIWSPLIEASPRVAKDLFHLTDWVPTLLSAAGGSYLLKNIKLDGKDQWKTITKGYPSPRSSILIEIDEVKNMTGLRLGNFKYILGSSPGKDGSKTGFLGKDFVDTSTKKGYNVTSVTDSKIWKALQKIRKTSVLESDILGLREESIIKCNPQENLPYCETNSCLFDLSKDPCEQKNLAKNFPSFTKFIEVLIGDYKSNIVPQSPLLFDRLSDPIHFNYTWNIWD